MVVADRPRRTLGGIDAAFLYAETPTMHMHIGMVCLLSTAGAPPGWSVDSLVTTLQQRLAAFPELRRKVVVDRLGLGAPAWVDDRSFSVANHVRRACTASPGGSSELALVVGEAMSEPLQRSRPLWDALVVEGLQEDLVAVVARAHHAVMDGGAGFALLRGLCDHGENGSWSPPPLGEDIGGADEGTGGLQGVAEALIRRSRLLPGVLLGATRSLTSHGPRPFGGIRTSLNVAISPRRTVAWASLDRSLLRRVRGSAGHAVATAEVVLAVCAGALRSLLQARGDEVLGPLACLVPTMQHRVRDTLNGASGVLVWLPTHLDDPVERLAACAGGSRDWGAPSPDLLRTWTTVLPPVVFGAAARAVSASRAFNHVAPLCNVVVSGIPGSSRTMRIGGVPLKAVFPLGPVTEGCALNITWTSYAGSVLVGLNACAEAVPGVEALVPLLETSLGELVSVLGGPPGPIAARVG